MLFIKLIENDKNNIYKNNELFIKLIENKKKNDTCTYPYLCWYQSHL